MTETEAGSVINALAQGGFSAAAARYVTGRPDYPAAAGQWLAGELGLGPGRLAVDLGAGTGKFSALLLETGAAVMAVEPVDEMRAELARLLPDVDARSGSATAIPLGNGLAQAVTCAQAFHWFASRQALAEIHRVLVPGGSLGLIWNLRDETVPWVAALTALLRPYEADAPRWHTLDWAGLFPADGFGAVHEQRFPQIHRGPAEQVIVDRVLSVSFIAILPEAERADVAARVRHLIATTPALSGREVIEFPYETRAYACRKL